ncbi:DUF4190 domain-containing protein [Streptomyces ardesiacus]|uniref:DUF4190 domain-containing protein n=1 Tax=Streptomyces ardesiacus TaxID=285564 RepID=UPI0033EBCC5D
MSIPPPPGPQGPYPQGPYAPPPWGHPYGPHPRQAPVNGLAVAAFVLGVLCCVPAVGLVLGLIALARIRKRGERGKGFAVAGSVLSSVGLVLWVLVFSTGAAADFWDGFRDAARSGTAFALEKGQCFNTPGGSLQGVTYDVDEVPCEQWHDGEVFAVFDLPDRGPYPGDREVTSTADERCYGLVDEYAMDTWALPTDVDVYYLTPTSGSWRAGDREITCLFGSTDEGTGLKGSLRNDASTLDAHQVAYLEAARVVDDALESTPESEYFEDDPAGYRAWAGRVEKALGEQIGMLGAHSWPSAAERPVTKLVADLEAARKEFAAAGTTPAADPFYEHLDEGYALVDGDTTVTARESLGLDTTPPEYEEPGGGGGDSPGKEV